MSECVCVCVCARARVCVVGAGVDVGGCAGACVGGCGCKRACVCVYAFSVCWGGPCWFWTRIPGVVLSQACSVLHTIVHFISHVNYVFVLLFTTFILN